MLERLDSLPRLGLITEPSPVSEHPELAAELSLSWLGAKRDDLLPALHGGSKVRKLDLLLAAPPWAQAASWTSMGAIGSGHLVALSAASERLGRPFHAQLFWEPVEDLVLDNLAFTASRATSLRFYGGRVGMGVRAPGLFLGSSWRGSAVIGPGGTHPPAVVGVMLAVRELALQIEQGLLPMPDRIVVALGSGGTAAGLVLGAGLWLRRDGKAPVVQAGAAVERVFTGAWRVRQIALAALGWLNNQGVSLPVELAPLQVDHSGAGPAYGSASSASREVTTRLRALGLPAEPIYTGKAFASLLRRPPAGERVLLWMTPRRAGPLPTDPGWRERLPPSLQARLEGRPSRARRAFLIASTGMLAFGAWRLLGDRGLPAPVPGLADWEAAVIRAAAEVVLPKMPGRVLDRIPAAVAAYSRSFPTPMRAEISGLLLAIDQGTLLSGHLDRFTRLSLAQREASLQALKEGPAPGRILYRGIRDLCLLGAWQQDALWDSIGYEGPWVPRAERSDRYVALASASPPPGWAS